MMTKSKELLGAILRNSFPCFIHKVFQTINPSSLYEHNWHIDLICDYLNEVERGNIKRLIINIPPRSLKSICVTVAWPAWLLGCNSKIRVIAASYAQNISIKHSLDCRFTVESDWYKLIFPETRISKKENRKSKFITTNFGMRFATSVGGSITGEGADILILDDPHNPNQINSERIRKKTLEWYEQTFVSRLNNKSKGAIVIVMQRLHSDDLCGYLEKNHKNSWEILKIPVQANSDHHYVISDKLYKMKEGETLHSDRDKKENLEKLYSEIGKENFFAQYMQDPVDNSVSILSFKDISYYDTIPFQIDYILQSWDTAIKTTEKSDYSVCTVWYIVGTRYYLVDFLKEKFAYPDLKRKIIDFLKLYNTKYLCIEDKSSGQSIIQDLRNEGFSNIIPIKPKGDKITRFASIVPYFQSGRILLPSQANYLKILLNEITKFPNTDHDDAVDSISQAINYLVHQKKPTISRIRLI
jgi:predicted phage terminase large subunit-like protein